MVFTSPVLSSLTMSWEFEIKYSDFPPYHQFHVKWTIRCFIWKYSVFISHHIPSLPRLHKDKRHTCIFVLQSDRQTPDKFTPCLFAKRMRHIAHSGTHNLHKFIIVCAWKNPFQMPQHLNKFWIKTRVPLAQSEIITIHVITFFGRPSVFSLCSWPDVWTISPVLSKDYKATWWSGVHKNRSPLYMSTKMGFDGLTTLSPTSR